MASKVDSADTALTHRRSFGTVARLATLLAFGTIAWQHLVHAWGSGASGPVTGHLAHALRDGALAWPLAALAVLVGLRLSRRIGLEARGGLDVVARAGLVAFGFAALMVPGVVGHAIVDAGLNCRAAMMRSTAESIASNLGRFMTHSVREALVALVAAMPLALLGLLTSSACPSSRAHRRWSRRLAPAAAIVTLLVAGGIGGAGPDVVEFEATD